MRLSNIHVALCCLIGLVDGIALGAQVGRGGAGLEVFAQRRGEERAEDDIGTTELISCWTALGAERRNLPEHGEREPQEEDKLENKVKGEPVDNVDEALNDGEEREDDPVLSRELADAWFRSF